MMLIAAILRWYGRGYFFVSSIICLIREIRLTLIRVRAALELFLKVASLRRTAPLGNSLSGMIGFGGAHSSSAKYRLSLFLSLYIGYPCAHFGEHVAGRIEGTATRSLNNKISLCSTTTLR